MAESFETPLARPSTPSEARLVALVDGDVAAFVSARLTEPDEAAGGSPVGKDRYDFLSQLVSPTRCESEARALKAVSV